MSADVVTFTAGVVPSPISQDWLITVRDLLKPEISVTCRERNNAIDSVLDAGNRSIGVHFNTVLRMICRLILSREGVRWQRGRHRL